MSDSSSPPISPGCEDQQISNEMHLDESFKKPLPPDVHRQCFPPFYGGYPHHLLTQSGSAFRPVDASGKPIPVSIIIVY